mgnify:CR=1 FL=1
MIKHLHLKNTPSFKNRRLKQKPKSATQQMLQQLSVDLLAPREQALEAIFAKAAALKLV